jgi:hypothetical protein
MLPIIVITRTTGCPAAYALTMEGLEVTECVMRVGDYSQYGRTFTAQWQSRNGFIVVEEDIVPWPGAINELRSCEHDWCCFMFPNGKIYWDPVSGFADGLGCMKFSTALVERTPVGPVWQHRGWDELDGAVHGTLKENDELLHVHNPPVAHAKAIVLTSKRTEIPCKV